MKKEITIEEINGLGYVDFLALLNETNRPAGGKDSIRRLALNSFLNEKSRVLHSGCNTGYCSFEICHLVKCKVFALDINENMINAAQKRLMTEPSFFRKKISFQVRDAHNLNFRDNYFDLVFSGGSTAFMKDAAKVVREYKRVCKPYGFVGDVCMFYKKQPPRDLLNKINSFLNITIKPWDQKFWENLYLDQGLELFYKYSQDMPYMPSEQEVMDYCRAMVADALRNHSEDIQNAAAMKFYEYMKLFNENHRYLSYCILLFRKDYVKEQVSLFGK